MSYLTEAIQQVQAWDDARPRSQQTEVGWSGVYGCRAWLGFMAAGEWATEDTDTWRACAGTALHAWIQDIRGDATTEDDVEFEVPLNYRGIPGNSDEVNWTRGEITDYKFPSLKSARLWADPEVLDERFTQIQGYAAAVMETQRWKNRFGDSDREPLTRFLICPVDGTFADWVTYERPFDRAVADLAADRYAEVKAVVALRQAGMVSEPLPKDKPLHFCQRFCEFFSLCRGGDKPDVGEEITDPMLASAVERYGLAREQIAGSYKTCDELRPMVEGLKGHARGWRVWYATPGRDQWEPDMDTIRADYEQQGLTVPMKQKNGGKPALYVKREKK